MSDDPRSETVIGPPRGEGPVSYLGDGYSHLVGPDFAMQAYRKPLYRDRFLEVSYIFSGGRGRIEILIGATGNIILAKELYLRSIADEEMVRCMAYICKIDPAAPLDISYVVPESIATRVLNNEEPDMDEKTFPYKVKRCISLEEKHAPGKAYILIVKFLDTEKVPTEKNRADGLSRVEWGSIDDESLEEAPFVDEFLMEDDDEGLPPALSCYTASTITTSREDCWGEKEEPYIHYLLTQEDEEEGWYGMVEQAVVAAHELAESSRMAERRLNEIEEKSDDQEQDKDAEERFRKDEYGGEYKRIGMVMSGNQLDEFYHEKTKRTFRLRRGHIFVDAKEGVPPLRVVCGNPLQDFTKEDRRRANERARDYRWVEAPGSSRNPPSQRSYLDPHEIVDLAFFQNRTASENEEVEIEAEEESSEEEEEAEEEADEEETPEEGSYSEHSEGEQSEEEEEEEEQDDEEKEEEDQEELEESEWEGFEEEVRDEARAQAQAQKREETAVGKRQLEFASATSQPLTDDPAQDPEPPKPEDGDPAAKTSAAPARRRRSRSPSPSTTGRPPTRPRTDAGQRASSPVIIPSSP
ncbi:hypothetical protein CBR_g31465 [Chara braunii]|uniref:Uncharacterized protein n=1 Tax=Chara braunii TaxID=69332 RepID=A0A388LF14_CHABU|nr:hypothetical protein CBR_g31465 [Chara braunii]|eukprot:GBG80909.1 hypothetical protein CBR_g31465 [Chara braunii]